MRARETFRPGLIVLALFLLAGCAGPQSEPPVGRQAGPAAPAVNGLAAAEREAAPDARDEPPASREIPSVSGVRLIIAPDGRRSVEVDAIVCLTEGWLEQVACSPGTREHEALFVIEAPARLLHAMLVAAEFHPGRPGRWAWSDEEGFLFDPPQGSPLRILVRPADAPRSAAVPVNEWIIAEKDGRTLPDRPFIFAGSRLVPAAEGEGEVYLAEHTGSLIGLVTFGDEVIGYVDVFADQSDVAPLDWIAHYEAMPPIGTAVVLHIEPIGNVDRESGADR